MSFRFGVSQSSSFKELVIFVTKHSEKNPLNIATRCKEIHKAKMWQEIKKEACAVRRQSFQEVEGLNAP